MSFIQPASGLLGSRIQRLRERIQWVRTELEQRRTLHKQFEAEIERDMRDLSLRAAHMTYPEIRQQLDNEVQKLKKDRRNNAAKAWKDVLELSDKLLELLDEYERLRALEDTLGRDAA